jgi:hypothetical protein
MLVKNPHLAVHILSKWCKSLDHFGQTCCCPCMNMFFLAFAIALVLMSYCLVVRLRRGSLLIFLAAASHSLISDSWVCRMSVLRVSPACYFAIVYPYTLFSVRIYVVRACLFISSLPNTALPVRLCLCSARVHMFPVFCFLRFSLVSFHPFLHHQVDCRPGLNHIGLS